MKGDQRFAVRPVTRDIAPSDTPQRVTALLDRIQEDLDAGRLVLPTLPEIALRVQRLLAQPEVSTDELTALLRADASIAARLLQLVNSPVYRAARPISDLRQAVTRLGLDQIQHLVAGFAAEQMFHSRDGELNRLLKETWAHSLKVASLSHLIAAEHTALNAEQAFLGGLIHDIGVLPVIKYAEETRAAPPAAILQQAIEWVHPTLGAELLAAWRFPEHLVAVAREHEFLERDPDPAPDYADVVLVANVLWHLGGPHPHAGVDPAGIPAFRKLSLTLDLDPLARELMAEIEGPPQP